jgi:hypothetical protein
VIYGSYCFIGLIQRRNNGYVALHEILEMKALVNFYRIEQQWEEFKTRTDWVNCFMQQNNFRFVKECARELHKLYTNFSNSR